MRLIPYQQVVGSLLFAAQISRPDIYFVVNEVSHYNHKIRKAHLIAEKCILHYLKCIAAAISNSFKRKM